MTNVVMFDPDANKPHATGPMKCTHCGHEWVQVTTLDKRGDAFDCPECKLTSGYYHGHSPGDDTDVRLCLCGCQIYYVMREGIMCVGCGTETTYVELAEDV